MAKNGVRVRGITIELNGDASGLVKSFKDVDSIVKKTQSNIAALSKYIATDNSWKGLQNKWSALTLQQTLMKQETEKLRDKIKQEKEILASLDKADTSDKVRQRQQALQTQIILDTEELRRMEEELKAFGKLGQQKAKAVADAFKQTGEEVKQFGQSMMATGRSLSMYVTTPIVGVGTAAMKTSMEFEAAMDKVQSVTPDATIEDMERLSQAVLDMSGKSKYSAAEASEALYYMGLAGWNVEEMLEALPQVLSVATAGEMDLGRASDIVTDYFTAFGEGAGTVEHMVDVMARTMISSNTDIDQLGNAFKYVAPVAGAMGFTIEDVSFALGLMANNGIKASQAGISLRQFMQRLVKPTAEVQKAMDELGISVADEAGNIKSFRQIMDELRVSLNGVIDPTSEAAQQINELNQQLEDGEISEEQYSEALEDIITNSKGVTGAEKAKNAAILAGVRGMSGLLAIVNATAQDYNDLSDAIEGTTTAQDIANVMIDNTQGRMEILKHSAENLGISFGQVMAPYIEKGISKLSSLVEWFGKLDDKQKDTIVRIAGIAAAVGPLLVAGGAVVTAIGSIMSAIGSLAGFVIMHPVIAGLTAAIALIGVLHATIVEDVDEERERLWGLTDDNKELIASIDDMADSYDELSVKKASARNDIESETANLQTLWGELQNIVDENGKVIEGYEGRAEVITSILSDALGIEIGLNGDIVEGYKDIEKEIDNLILKKKQEMILAASQEKYTEALLHSKDAQQKFTSAVSAYESAQAKTRRTLALINSAQAEVNRQTKLYGEASYDAVQALADAQSAHAEAAAAEDELRRAMEESREVYYGMQNDIVNYETAYAASLSGNVQLAEDAMNALLYDFKHYGAATEQELKDQQSRYQAMYEQSQKDAAAGVAGVTQETVDGYARMAQMAQDELDKYYNVVKRTTEKATETSKKNATQMAEATRDGLTSVDFSAPGSDNIKEYIGGMNSQQKAAEDAAKAAAARTKYGLNSTDMTAPGSEHMEEYAHGIQNSTYLGERAARTAAEKATVSFGSVNMLDSGMNWAKGVAEGIRDYIYTIEDAANAAAQAGKRGFNQPIAIKSPSKVMMESGKNFDLGIAIGIEDNKDLVVKQAEDLAEETAAAMTWNTANPLYGLSGSNSIQQKTFNMGGMNLQIYQQPGENAEDFAERIVDRIYREVEQRQAVFA